MPAGVYTDFKIYDDQFQTAMTEVLQQETDVFNGGSRGALVLRTELVAGHYERQTFFPLINNLITRRDISSVAPATSLKLTQSEIISVKANRKIGPVEQTLDAWRKIQADPGALSVIVGEQAGKVAAVDMVDRVLGCIKAALVTAGATHGHDATADTPPTMNHTSMVTALSKFGDQSNRLICWVMHSKQYFDLVKQAISDKIVEVAGVTIYSGNVATFNRPTIVVDSAALIDTVPNPDVYFALCLVQGAGAVRESEPRVVLSEIVSGHENIMGRVQGEYAYNLGVLGFQWDTTNGGVNPTDAALSTGTNWDKVLTDVKSCAGVWLKTQ